ncbi:MAG: hypothetical protein A2X79_00480 [Desulfuromonadaceae bacterium GWB2_53_15]|nr:MAG: hypothetical protein A2010_14330 [Nitrospirae bacterium GWD2_57_9]OHB32644.1 MAG: hypothetical protein A2X79_00480 [Desulfuromonadaceae bacterium GWB2_53_15]
MKFIIVVMFLSLAAPSLGLAVPATPATQNAVIEYNRENYEEALALLEQARQGGDSSALNSYYSGLCRKQTGDDGGAAENFKEALKGPSPEKDAAAELVAVLVNLERFDEAMTWVAWAEKEQVKPQEIAYLKGLILSQQKRYPEARAAFNAAKTGSAEPDQQTDFQIALTLAQEGKKQEARESLRAIVTRYPGTDVATFAQEYEQRMSAAGTAKLWNVFAGINYQYDDNVLLKSKVPQANAITRNERSGGISENLRIEYNGEQTSAWSANLQYALQNNNYFRISDYNMLSHALTFSPIHRNEAVIVALPLNVTHTTLDYASYSFQYSFKPSATFVFTPHNLGQLSFGYSRRNMFQEPVTPENDRDANIFNAQAGYIFLYGNGQGMFNLRGEAFYEDTTGSDWRNLGGRAGLDLLIPVTQSTKLILTAEGTWQDYLDSIALRKDTIVNASATVNQKLYRNLYLNLQYYYSRALSNVDFYDCQRNVISSGFELRF